MQIIYNAINVFDIHTKNYTLKSYLISNKRKKGNDNGFNLNEAWKYHNTIKQALLKAQEQEKVLEILKEKYVEVYILLKSKNVEQYNFNIRFGKKLTEDEFKLLKRYFK